MKRSTMIFRSLVHNRRSNAGVVAGAALATAVLVGALLVGDSVRYSLRRLASLRLGRTELVLLGGDRIFRAELADDLAAKINADVAPIIVLQGSASLVTGASAPNVQVLGVGKRFWTVGGVSVAVPELSGEEALVNARLAEKLGLSVGDSLVLRVGKSGVMPGEAGLVSLEAGRIMMRVTVRGVAGPERFGHFSLKSDQVGPLNVFVSRDQLSRLMGQVGRANVLLLAGRDDVPITTATAQAALRQAWQLEDAGLTLEVLADRSVNQLRSERVFLGAGTTRAALRVHPNAKPVITYLVNNIRANGASIPYSFVSAPGGPVVPGNMKDDEIVVNQWTADDLQIGVGAPVHLDYYVFGQMRALVETTAVFRVGAIVPMSGPSLDPALMPLLPGITDAEDCADWDSGIPIDLDKVRKKDEAYWDAYRGTPKAFVTFARAEGMWRNTYGVVTAVRYPGGDKVYADVSDGLLSALEPASLNLVFRAVKHEALLAVDRSIDFGGLFIGLSFFLILAALVLTGLLFAFGIENRTSEAGTLLALGWRRNDVRRLQITEGCVLAASGSIIGAVLGVGYNQGVLRMLATVWRGAVGTSALVPHIRVLSIVIGVGTGIVAATIAMWLATRRQAIVSVRQLQSGPLFRTRGRSGPMWPGWAVSSLCVCGAVAVVVTAGQSSGVDTAGLFFLAGSLLLTGLIVGFYALLQSAGRTSARQRLSTVTLALRGTLRRKGRSLAAGGVLACGVFVVVAVGANRRGMLPDVMDRQSGTGGFAFWAETAVPITQDLNSRDSRKQLGANDAGIEFVQMRLRDGDDASCLNLNRPQRPRLLGVDPAALGSRGAFRFVATAANTDASDPWSVLAGGEDSNCIPGVADMSVITWGLGKKLGDTIEYVDDTGRTFKIKLVGALENSVFQGNIIISEESFLVRFPSHNGTRVFLMDAPRMRLAEATSALSQSLRDLGLELTPAAERLAQFTVVQNTYLLIFLALGGLGLAFGSAGMGVVVLRNVLERRAELAVLRAVGFTSGALYRLVFVEHAVILTVGLAIGLVSALVAVFPAVGASGAKLPVGLLTAVTVGIAASGSLWVALAVRVSLRGDLVSALRNQ